MDHDDTPIGTILTRREALRAAATAGFSLALGGAVQARQSQSGKAVHIVVTPEVTEGPFFVDEGLNRRDVTQGTTRKTVVEGTPLILRFEVHAIRGGQSRPLEDAQVDIWHSDAAGTYSDEDTSPIQAESTKGQKWLRGYQKTDADGKVEFRTIYPGWYNGRTIHVHVKVRSYDPQTKKTHDFTTQLYFDESTNDAVVGNHPYNTRGERHVRNHADKLYSLKQADGTMVGSHLHCSMGKPDDGGARVAYFSLALKLD